MVQQMRLRDSPSTSCAPVRNCLFDFPGQKKIHFPLWVSIWHGSYQASMYRGDVAGDSLEKCHLPGTEISGKPKQWQSDHIRDPWLAELKTPSVAYSFAGLFYDYSSTLPHRIMG